MSVVLRASRWIPYPDLWVIAALVILTGFTLSWTIAAGVLVFLLSQVARPLDFMTSFLVLIGGASLVYNEGGGMTTQLGMLSIVTIMMLACYLVAMKQRALSFVRLPLTWPILAYVGLSILNAGRGFLTGYSPKWINLEFFPALALGTAILVGNAFEPRKHLRSTIVALIAISVAPTARGYYMFWIARTHTTGLYNVASPAIIGLLVFNLALRARKSVAALGWIALSLPLFVQVLLTFGRGVWTGTIAGLLGSSLLFAGFGAGSGPRWRRVSLIVGSFLLLVFVGALQAAVIFGQGHLLETALLRFTSITAREPGINTMSTVIRLFEYMHVLTMIQHSPWVGYGLGFTFTLKQPWAHHIGIQWGVHQNYLLVWLKQGIVGLALFLWMLGTAIVWCSRQARRAADTWESTWYATAANATLLLAVLSMTNYPFDTVNETFLLAMLWGGSIALARSGKTMTLRWSPARTGPRLAPVQELSGGARRLESFPR